MMWSAIVGVLLLCASGDSAPTRMERTTVSKMRMADLETSASGYVYHQQQGLPASYMQYTNHGSGRYYDAPDPLHYVVGVAAPVAPVVSEAAPAVAAYATTLHETIPYEQQSYTKGEIANYAAEQLPKYAPALVSINQRALAPYYEEVQKPTETETHGETQETDGDDADTDEEDHDDDGDEDQSQDGEENTAESDHDDDGDDKDDDDDNYDHNEDSENHHAPEAFGFNDYHFAGKLENGDNHRGSSSESDNGKRFSALEYSEGGEKGDKGYKTHHEFDKGEDGHSDNESKKGYYEIEGGHKKENTDTAGEYGSTHNEEQAEEGSDYGKSSFHKNGHKTTGFHKVYHKDEYKKDSDFYDNAKKEGHFEKYDTLNEQHKAAEGGYKKGGNHYSGFENEENGKKGYYDKGHHVSSDQGHKAEGGQDSYYDNHSEYAKKGATNSGKNYGFSS